MRLLYAVPAYGHISQTFVRDLLVGLAKKADEVVLLCNQLIETPVLPNRVTAFEAKYQVDTLSRRLRRAAHRRWGPGSLEAYEQEKARSALSRTLKRIVEAHAIDVAYLEFGKMGVYLGQALRDQGIPFYCHFHGSDITSRLSNRSYRNALPSLFDASSGLIVASEHIRRLLVLEGANQESVSLVRHGVNVDSRLIPLSWEVRAKNPKQVVFLGRLVEKKHPVALVESFRLVLDTIPDAKLLIVGDGPERQKVEARVRKHGMTRSVTLVGALPREKALPLVNESWVYAQHSVTARDGDQEGFGVSLAEAAFLGLPVVSTLHNGIPEQVVHGETGYLVLEHDYEQMAQHIVDLLSDSTLCHRLGTAGGNRIRVLCNSERRIDAIWTMLKGARHSE